jgi:hypothetical protein
MTTPVHRFIRYGSQSKRRRHDLGADGVIELDATSAAAAVALFLQHAHLQAQLSAFGQLGRVNVGKWASAARSRRPRILRHQDWS